MNTQFGKITNGALQYAPNPLWVGHTMIANPTAEIYAQNGWLPIDESEAMPDAEEGFYFIPSYAEDEAGTKIVRSWERTALPSEETMGTDGSAGGEE